MANYTEIDDPTAFFQCELWTGNGSARSITLSGNSDLQPDMVWLKQRSGTENHNLYDSIRGAGIRLIPNLNNSESTTNELTAFNSDGFSLADGDEVNKSSSTYVAWNWKAGTSFTNDASSTSIGSIDSAGSFNNTCGFSIVSWTGTGSAGTIKHGLNSTPKMIIVKNRGAGELWLVYHKSLGATKFLRLAGSEAVQTLTSTFNDTEPTSSVFTVGSNEASNRNGYNMIAYCFAEKQGFSKFGSYTGSANADGPYIHLGFKPAFLVIKQSSSERNWIMMDNKRSPFNIVTKYMKGNSDSAEETYNYVDFLSTGFKCRDSDTGANASGGTYIYYAFAENPFVTSTGVSGLAR